MSSMYASTPWVRLYQWVGHFSAGVKGSEGKGVFRAARIRIALIYQAAVVLLDPNEATNFIRNEAGSVALINDINRNG